MIRPSVRIARVPLEASHLVKHEQQGGRLRIGETYTRRKGRQLLSPCHPRKFCRGNSCSDVGAWHFVSDYRHTRIEETHSRYSFHRVYIVKKLRAVSYFRVWRERVIHIFLVCQLPTDAADLLGANFLEEAAAIVRFERCELLIPEGRHFLQARDDALEERTAFAVFTKSEEESSPQPLHQGPRQSVEQIQTNPPPEAASNELRSWLVKASENIVLAPHCRQVVEGRLELKDEQCLPPLVIVEPFQIPIQGIFPARALSRIESSAPQFPS